MLMKPINLDVVFEYKIDTCKRCLRTKLILANVGKICFINIFEALKQKKALATWNGGCRFSIPCQKNTKMICYEVFD